MKAPEAGYKPIAIIVLILAGIYILNHLWILFPIFLIGVPVGLGMIALGLFRITWYGGKNLKDKNDKNH
jgi:hypothetical protein